MVQSGRVDILLFATVFYIWIIYFSTFRPWANESTELVRKLSSPSSRSFANLSCSYLRPEDNYHHTNLLFLKTHKCGTGTITRILMRFGLQHNLNFMILQKGVYNKTFSAEVLANETRTPDDRYNLMPYHVRYSPQIKRLMYADTKTVTILRDPATRFESEYAYNKMYTQGDKLTFEQFVKSPPATFSRVGFDNAIGYNQMSFDLGFDRELDGGNETAIRFFIEYIDREFDFVMITEHMDVSLVLLVNLMGWPLEYVRYLRIHVRRDDIRYELTESDKLELLRLNYADTLLYEHFYRKFIKCVVSYGVERMNADLSRLRRMNEELSERCIGGETLSADDHGTTIQYENKNSTDEECVYWSKESSTILAQVSSTQKKRFT